MPSYFSVTLDTTAPSFTLEVVAGEGTLITLLVKTADADTEDVKIWGSIDPTDPINGSYGEDEAGATWLPYAEGWEVRVSPGPGQKQFFVRARDDVWNESVESISFVVAEPEVAPAPSPLPGGPPERLAPARRRIESTTRIGVESRAELIEQSRVLEVGSAATVSTRSTVSRVRSIEVERSLVATDIRSAIRAKLDPEELPVGVVSDHQVFKRRGKADDDAILALLL